MRVLSTIFILAVASGAVFANPRLAKRQAAEEPPVAPDTAAAAADAAEPAAPPAAPAPPAPPAPARPPPARPAPAARPAPPPPPPPPPPPAGAAAGGESPQGRQAGPRPVQPQGPSSGLTLADGADVIVGQIQDTFSCQDKIYGYYADVDNGCKIFHVCVPIQDENGQQTAPSLRFSFFCNNGTVFNQAALVCDHEDNIDCASSPSFYNVNEEFGKIEPRAGPGAAEGRRAPPVSPPQPPPANRPPPPPAPPAPEAPPTPAAA